MNTITRSWIAGLIVLLTGISGCEDHSSLTLPDTKLDLENGTYVAVGNSITAGLQNDALYKEAQKYSYPALLARQMRVESFEQPLISSPGISSRGRIEVVNLQTLATTRNDEQGQPVNTNIGHPYHNLGLPNAEISDYLNEQNTLSERSLYPLIINDGNPQNPLSSIHRAVQSLEPDLVTFWMGNNAILDYASSGGLKPFTDPQAFASQYGKAISAIESLPGDPTTVVLNIPSIQSIPFATRIGPVLRGMLQGKQDVPGLVVQKTFYQQNASIGASENREPAGLVETPDLADSDSSLVLLTARDFLPLLGITAEQQAFQQIKSYWLNFLVEAGVINQNEAQNMSTDELEQTLTDFTIAQYEETFGSVEASQFAQQYPGFEFDDPFGFSARSPFPNQFVLDQNEISISSTLTGIYNATIEQHGDVQVDMHAHFNQILKNGYNSPEIDKPLTPTIGSLFSLDGVHPTNKAQAVITNKIIEKLNRSLDAAVPKVDLRQIPRGIPIDQSPPEAF